MRVFSLCLSLLAGASLAVSTSPPGRPAPHSACPLGWTDRTGSGLGCILLDLETKRNWNEAQDFCRDLADAHLVEIFRGAGINIDMSCGMERMTNLYSRTQKILLFTTAYPQPGAAGRGGVAGGEDGGNDRLGAALVAGGH